MNMCNKYMEKVSASASFLSCSQRGESREKKPPEELGWVCHCGFFFNQPIMHQFGRGLSSVTVYHDINLMEPMVTS